MLMANKSSKWDEVRARYFGGKEAYQICDGAGESYDEALRLLKLTAASLKQCDG